MSSVTRLLVRQSLSRFYLLGVSFLRPAMQHVTFTILFLFPAQRTIFLLITYKKLRLHDHPVCNSLNWVIEMPTNFHEHNYLAICKGMKTSYDVDEWLRIHINWLWGFLGILCYFVIVFGGYCISLLNQISTINRPDAQISPTGTVQHSCIPAAS